IILVDVKSQGGIRVLGGKFVQPFDLGACVLLAVCSLVGVGLSQWWRLCLSAAGTRQAQEAGGRQCESKTACANPHASLHMAPSVDRRIGNVPLFFGDLIFTRDVRGYASVRGTLSLVRPLAADALELSAAGNQSPGAGLVRHDAILIHSGRA